MSSTNFDLILNEIITKVLVSYEQKQKMIRLPLNVSLNEAREILHLLSKMREEPEDE